MEDHAHCDLELRTGAMQLAIEYGADADQELLAVACTMYAFLTTPLQVMGSGDGENVVQFSGPRVVQ